MKIGILTFHKPINYGAFLQAYSLSNKLREVFPSSSVEIVDYIAPKEKKKITINVLWGIKHYGIVNGIQDIKKIKAFKKSYSNLTLSRSISTNNLNKLFSYIDSEYDLLVIGSDAVFNWNQNGYPTAFIPNYNFKKCQIVTYAASVHGLRYLDEDKEKLIECGRAFDNMALIGVRDCNTENFVRCCSTKGDIIHCCDPTVIINIDKVLTIAGNYVPKIRNKFSCDLSKKYIVVMLPDGQFTQKIYERYSKEYQIITLFKPSKHADYYLYDLNPFEWAAVLSKAAVVITSYFHGTLLALKQNTPVVCVDYSNYNFPYEGKLKDLLLTRFNLQEFYFESDTIDNLEVQKQAFDVIGRALDGEYNSRINEAIQSESLAFETFLNKLCRRVKSK